MIGLLILVQTCTTYCLYLFVACGGAQTDAGSDTKSPFWCMCVFFSSWTPINHKKKRILNYGLCILSWELLKQAELCCFCLWKNMWSVIANDFKRASYWLVVWSVCRFHPKFEDPFDSRWMAWKYQPLTLHLRENLKFYRKHGICSNVFHMLLHEMSSIFC